MKKALVFGLLMALVVIGGVRRIAAAAGLMVD